MSHDFAFQSMTEFYDYLPDDQKEIVDVLRQIVLHNINPNIKERLINNVPYYYGKKRICMIWPAAIKGGGIKQGVLLGFSWGCKLADVDNYLIHGTNKRIFYRIYKSVEELNEASIVLLLKEACELDARFN